MQSGLRPNHSTETAHITTTDNFMIFSKGGMAALILLDLSAAFDTVSHPILIRCLYKDGIQGPALRWICILLTDRTQAVSLAPYSSDARKLICGVLQGSLLSLIYTYMIPLANIFSYAEHTQLILFLLDKTPKTRNKFTTCMTKVANWKKANCHKLNTDKTDIVIFGKNTSPWESNWWPAKIRLTPRTTPATSEYSSTANKT